MVQQLENILKKLIFLVGYAGSGKSYLANVYKKNNYHIISTDELIRNNIMKDARDIIHFSIYNEKRCDNKDLQPTVKKFVKLIKDDMKKYDKIVIEGQLPSQMINKITGKNKFDIICVKPKNKTVYIEHLINRFENDPANYGRIGFLKMKDAMDGNSGLNNYIKYGTHGKLFRKMIRKMANEKYHKHAETYEYYKKYYNNVHLFTSG